MTGNENNLVLQADFRLGTSSIRTSHFGISNDGPDVDPFPGNSGDEAIANFGLDFVGAGFVDSFTLIPYAGPRYDTALGSAGSNTDWFRIRLEADLTANGGEGSGSLYYMNLTLGETSFTPVAGIQNVSLHGLTSGSDPTQWDSLYVRVHEGSQMDNLFIVIPEPSSLTLLAIGAVVFLGYIWCRKRQRFFVLSARRTSS